MIATYCGQRTNLIPALMIYALHLTGTYISSSKVSQKFCNSIF